MVGFTFDFSTTTATHHQFSKPGSKKFQRVPTCVVNIDHPTVLYRPAYSKKDYSGTEIAFTPNQRVPNLKKLDMGNEIESMKITCGP